MTTNTKLAIGGALLLGAGLYLTFVHKNSTGLTLAERIRLKNVPGRTVQGADGYTERQDEGNMEAVLAKAGFNATGKKDKYNKKLEDLKKQGLTTFADGHGSTLP
ncbi:MAG TPA: hypothetical protein PK289_00040 [Bacteroidia bacterium]|nr:hypothetical protein [Bacteroidia bacterium]